MLECVYYMKCPYTMETKKNAYKMYEKLYSKYNDKENIPDFQLVYAGIMKLLPLFNQKPSCYFCKKNVCIKGIVYPIDNGLIVPIPICYDCGYNEKNIKVNNVECGLKHYTWKMVLNASVSERMYEKMMEEESKKEEENRKIFEEMNIPNQDFLIKNNNGYELFVDIEKENKDENYYVHIFIGFVSTLLLLFYLYMN